VLVLRTKGALQISLLDCGGKKVILPRILRSRKCDELECAQFGCNISNEPPYKKEMAIKKEGTSSKYWLASCLSSGAKPIFLLQTSNCRQHV
jgi:hypothetical protein